MLDDAPFHLNSEAVHGESHKSGTAHPGLKRLKATNLVEKGVEKQPLSGREKVADRGSPGFIRQSSKGIDLFGRESLHAQ